MGFDSNQIISSTMPLIKNFLFLIFGGALVGGLAYYLFVIKRRKKWLVDVWEKKADGKIYLVAQDTLLEKKYNHGRQTAYVLKNAKVEVIPPPIECVHRYRGKEYVSYLRMLTDYVPMKNDIRLVNANRVKKAFAWIKRKDKGVVDSRFTYAPLNKEIVGSLKFEPVDYDVSLMMTNSLDTIDKIYKEKLSFWEKYGSYFAIGVVIVLVIVVVYLSYDYGNNVLSQVSGKLGGLTDSLTKLTQNLGGNVPPQ